MPAPKAVIFGCQSHQLTAEERRLFSATRPFGLILFARNIDTPRQVLDLSAEFRACVGRAEAPVLIDQEGGRVARLKSPHWEEYPAAAKLGRLYEHDAVSGIAAAKLLGRLLAWQLRPFGITVNCAPVADLRFDGADNVIGDRAFSTNPESVAKLARAVCDGLMAGGVFPVIKHLPGHGRATADTHKEKAVVDTPLEELRKTDFVPFSSLRDMPFGMTAHVTYSAIDPDNSASLSPKVIQVIRRQIKFSGLLMSDDLTMKALTGDMAALAKGVLKAGCDLALYCKHDVDEMTRIAEVVGPMSAEAVLRWQKARKSLRRLKLFDPSLARAEFRQLLGHAPRS